MGVAGRKLTIGDARRRWFAAQALPFRAKSPRDAVADSGFIRTLGGVDVYLALRARVKGLRRTDVDGAVAAGDLRVVPTVRGCIYLVDRPEVPWSLRIADLLSRKRRAREYEKVGIQSGELERLGASVLEVLEKGPASTAELRKAVVGEVRSLGAIGKTVGVSSTLPPTLRELEFKGVVERTLPGGRLETERYEWRVSESDPFAGGFTDDPAEVYAHMAAKFFGAVGVGSVDRFAGWAGIGKRDARAAIEGLGLTPLEVDGLSELQMVVGDLPEAGSGVAFLPFEDNLIQLQPGVANLVDPSHHHIPVPRWGRGKEQNLGTASHMAFRSIVMDGEIVGVWEFDPDQDRVVVGTFAALGSESRGRVDDEADQVSHFLKNEIGGAISFSLDTEDDLRRRSVEIRTLEAS